MILCADNLYPNLSHQLNMVDQVLTIPKVATLYPGIRNHADLHTCPTADVLYLSKEIEPLIRRELLLAKVNYEVIATNLGTSYPSTASLNVVLTETHLIHNPKTTCQEIIAYAETEHIKKLPVKQGYTRCTTLPLNMHTFITDDKGIHKALLKEQMHAYLIEGNHVQLPHQRTGFIGGSAGVIGDTVYFNGDVTLHPSYETIRRACDQAKLSIKYVPNRPLVDIGSILMTT